MEKLQQQQEEKTAKKRAKRQKQKVAACLPAWPRAPLVPGCPSTRPGSSRGGGGMLALQLPREQQLRPWCTATACLRWRLLRRDADAAPHALAAPPPQAKKKVKGSDGDGAAAQAGEGAAGDSSGEEELD